LSERSNGKLNQGLQLRPGRMGRLDRLRNYKPKKCDRGFSPGLVSIGGVATKLQVQPYRTFFSPQSGDRAQFPNLTIFYKKPPKLAETLPTRAIEPHFPTGTGNYSNSLRLLRLAESVFASLRNPQSLQMSKSQPHSLPSGFYISPLFILFLYLHIIK